jgi:hypothetical protein
MAALGYSVGNTVDIDVGILGADEVEVNPVAILLGFLDFGQLALVGKHRFKGEGLAGFNELGSEKPGGKGGVVSRQCPFGNAQIGALEEEGDQLSSGFRLAHEIAFGPEVMPQGSRVASHSRPKCLRSMDPALVKAAPMSSGLT